ncbi:putative nucleic acid-binding protein [Paucibacter oligotrophus]|uniref:Putative nucleic acid-binding protein n=1 Tax=Roseateles oligotrophus TaxID=1769250 RepID=A0A840LCZ0_9BURK|nr:putative nucleic acid-binding protein [Roseateles oligotrophus]
MVHAPRLVLDTNVLASAFLWGGVRIVSVSEALRIIDSV